MKNTANKPALERTTSSSSSAAPKADAGEAIAVAANANADVDTVEADVGATSTPERRRFKEVWLVEDRREGKSMWTRVGTAFENNDGSWNIRLSALPVAGGRLNMRDPLVRTDEEREHRQSARKVAA